MKKVMRTATWAMIKQAVKFVWRYSYKTDISKVV